MSGQRYAILIGNSHFPNESKLQDLCYPKNDIEAIGDIFDSEKYGNYTEVIRFHDETSRNIRIKLNQLLRNAKKDDIVVIYYSGHGKQNDIGELCLATNDTVFDALEATSLSIDEIRRYIDISPTNKIVLILDCCYSGAAGRAFTKGAVDDQLQLTSSSRGIYVMTASTGIQVAQEKEGDQYGVFTKHIIDGIKSGKADRDVDGWVSVDELYEYVDASIGVDAPQKPMKWDINVQGRLAICKSGRKAQEELCEEIRARLQEMSANENLSDTVFIEALEILRKSPDSLSSREKKYYILLETMHEKKLSVRRLTDLWFEISRADTAKITAKKEKKVISDDVRYASAKEMKPASARVDKPTPIADTQSAIEPGRARKSERMKVMTVVMIVLTALGVILTILSGADNRFGYDDLIILRIAWFLIALYGAFYIRTMIRNKIVVGVLFVIPTIHLFLGLLLINVNETLYIFIQYHFQGYWWLMLILGIMVISAVETFREIKRPHIKPANSLTKGQRNLIKSLIITTVICLIIDTGNIWIYGANQLQYVFSWILPIIGFILAAICLHLRLWIPAILGLISAWPFYLTISWIFYAMLLTGHLDHPDTRFAIGGVIYTVLLGSVIYLAIRSFRIINAKPIIETSD